MENAKRRMPELILMDDPYEVCKDVDCLFILHDWPGFSALDFEKIKGIMKEDVIFDSRNILNKEKIEKIGFTYFGIGR